MGRIRGTAVGVDVPALGWRFWSFGGFPDVPVAPRPDIDTCRLPLASVGTYDGDR